MHFKIHHVGYCVGGCHAWARENWPIEMTLDDLKMERDRIQCSNVSSDLQAFDWSKIIIT